MIDNNSTYNLVVQEYLGFAIRKIMKLLQEGKLSDYCFYITFDRHFSDNVFPEQNEDVVTIVLQHRFWELEIDEDGFEVIIEINNKKERVYVCFDSILLFTDQAANFILDFRNIKDDDDEEEDGDSQGIIFVELP